MLSVPFFLLVLLHGLGSACPLPGLHTLLLAEHSLFRARWHVPLTLIHSLTSFLLDRFHSSGHRHVVGIGPLTLLSAEPSLFWIRRHVRSHSLTHSLTHSLLSFFGWLLSTILSGLSVRHGAFVWLAYFTIFLSPLLLLRLPRNLGAKGEQAHDDLTPKGFWLLSAQVSSVQVTSHHITFAFSVYSMPFYSLSFGDPYLSFRFMAHPPRF